MPALGSWLRSARSRVGVAFGDGFLLAARLAARGRRFVVLDLFRQELPEGLVAPSSVDLNIRSVAELARLSGEALGRVGCRGGRLGLLLPDLALRGFVLPLAQDVGREGLLDSLAPRLAFPRAEAVVDSWRSGPSSFLAAVVHRQILHQYEHTFEALGCQPSVVLPASMAALPDWTRSARSTAGGRAAGSLVVHLQLYPRHYTLSVFRGAELVDVRLKLASDGPSQIIEETGRLASFYDRADLDGLSIRGERAGEVYELAVAARLAPGRTELGEEGEQAHLAALFPAVAPRI
jgi:hypothetical protein